MSQSESNQYHNKNPDQNQNQNQYHNPNPDQDRNVNQYPNQNEEFNIAAKTHFQIIVEIDIATTIKTNIIKIKIKTNITNTARINSTMEVQIKIKIKVNGTIKNHKI